MGCVCVCASTNVCLERRYIIIAPLIGNVSIYLEVELVISEFLERALEQWTPRKTASPREQKKSHWFKDFCVVIVCVHVCKCIGQG